MILRMAWASLMNRRLTAALTVASVALSVFLLLGVETVRNGAREGFASTISGTDLIVGARSGGVNLLLYAVFHIGNATNNVTWESYEDVANRPEVAWIVPISLGDSHRGFRVMGTTTDYFARFAYGRGQHLALAEGAPFDDLFDAVLGADVAETLGYAPGDEIVLAHGAGRVSFQDHADKPFRVAGILAPTGTPVDRTVLVSLEAIEAIHVDWRGGAAPRPGTDITASEARALDLTPRAVTAAFVGLTSPIAALSLQRWINDYREEPLSAILPGVALAELWSVVGAAETALLVVSALVVVTALIGLVATILTGLEARRREIAILRSVGAGPRDVLALLMIEAASLTLAGIVLGTGLLYAALLALRPAIETSTGLAIATGPPGPRELGLLAAVFAGGLLAALVPAVRAYRMSLAGGLTVRV